MSDEIRRLRLEQKKYLDNIGIIILIWMAANFVTLICAFAGVI
jgi:hypothetical protein